MPSPGGLACDTSPRRGPRQGTSPAEDYAATPRFSLGFCPFLLCAMFYTLLSLYFHRPDFCASQASSNFSIELSFWYVRILAVFSCFNLVDFSIAILVPLVLRPPSFCGLFQTAWLLHTHPGRGHVGRQAPGRKSGYRNFHILVARPDLAPFLINFEPRVCSVFDNKRLPPACLIWAARFISMWPASSIGHHPLAAGAPKSVYNSSLGKREYRRGVAHFGPAPPSRTIAHVDCRYAPSGPPEWERAPVGVSCFQK